MRGDPHPLFLYGGVFDEKPGDRNFTSDPADDLDSYDKEKTGGKDENVNLAMGQLGVQVSSRLMLQCCWWIWWNLIQRKMAVG